MKKKYDIILTYKDGRELPKFELGKIYYSAWRRREENEAIRDTLYICDEAFGPNTITIIYVEYPDIPAFRDIIIKSGGFLKIGSYRSLDTEEL